MAAWSSYRHEGWSGRRPKRKRFGAVLCLVVEIPILFNPIPYPNKSLRGVSLSSFEFSGWSGELRGRVSAPFPFCSIPKAASLYPMHYSGVSSSFPSFHGMSTLTYSRERLQRGCRRRCNTFGSTHSYCFPLHCLSGFSYAGLFYLPFSRGDRNLFHCDYALVLGLLTKNLKGQHRTPLRRNTRSSCLGCDNR